MADIADLQDNAVHASALLKTLANEWRLMILCHLTETELSVGELERILGLNQSALSQHLAVLRRQGIVKTRRQAQQIYYSIANDKATSIISKLYDLYCAADAGGGQKN
ncbi:MAG: metalloregulator ArsR/SmtB family transcription factor [Hyphomicrobiales bacterium]